MVTNCSVRTVHARHLLMENGVVYCCDGWGHGRILVWDGPVRKERCSGIAAPHAAHIVMAPNEIVINCHGKGHLPETDEEVSKPTMFRVPSDEPSRLSAISEICMASWEKFAEAYAEYGDGAADETALAGQWADLYRKINKLKRSMWAGDNTYLTRESAATILHDLVGHAWLALEMLERGETGGRAAD